MGFSDKVDKLIGIQGDQVKAEQDRRAFLDKGAAKRVEQDNEKMRQEQQTQTIFHNIAAGIDNLAEGVANIKAEDVGKGLLAPIGLIGAVIVSFVSGFVVEVKIGKLIICYRTTKIYIYFSEKIRSAS